MSNQYTLIEKFAKFVFEKREALGISQGDLAIEIYRDEEYTKWRDYFKDKDKKALSSIELKFYANYKKLHDKLSKKRTFISDIETGRRQSITFQTMDRILKALNSEIDFKENANVNF